MLSLTEIKKALITMANKAPCTNIRFASRKEAKAYLKNQNRRGHLKRKLKNVYYHKDCGCWHTTSQSKVQSRNFGRFFRNQKGTQ